MTSKFSTKPNTLSGTMTAQTGGPRGGQSVEGDKTTKKANLSVTAKGSKQKSDATLLEPGWVCCQEPSHCMDETATTQADCTPVGDDCDHPKCAECWLVRIIPEAEMDAMDRIANPGPSTDHGWFCTTCKRHFLDVGSEKTCTLCGPVTAGGWMGTRRVTAFE